MTVRLTQSSQSDRGRVESRPSSGHVLSRMARLALGAMYRARNYILWTLRWTRHWLVWAARWTRHWLVWAARWTRYWLVLWATRGTWHWLAWTVLRTRLLRPRLGWLIQHDPRPMKIPACYALTQAPTSLPRISIVTPSFNQADLLDRTIRSVLEQGYPNLEYIVQDGGSSDRTVEVLGRFDGRLHHWESAPDNGQADAINRGFAHTTGEIMAYLNSDDLFLPGALNYVAQYFQEHPEVHVVYGHRILIDENDQEIGRWVLPSHDDNVLSWADYVPQETLFWRRRIWEKTKGCIDESFQFAMDWDLLLRFRQAGAAFVRLPRFLGAFRVHPKQKTAAISDIGMREMKRLRKRTLGYAPDDAEVHINIAPYLFRHLICHYLYRTRLVSY